MWISKIELTNFKSYPHAELDFPEPTDGRNIVLIGGMNGYGKTSILEALYLALYGKDAIIHLARAGLKTDDIRGYPTFLERAFNGVSLFGIIRPAMFGIYRPVARSPQRVSNDLVEGHNSATF